jgi:hypothetical protein
MKHKTFTIYCTQQHRMATCQPHNHLCNRILCDTSLAVLFAYYAFTHLPPSYSKCTLLPSIPHLPSAAIVRNITSRTARVLRHCLGPHKGSSERVRFGCGQLIKASLPSESAQFGQSNIQRCQNCLSYGLTLFLFMNCLQNATLAPSIV